MNAVQAALYVVACVLLFLSAFIDARPRVSLALLGAAFALLAYIEPGLAGLGG